MRNILTLLAITSGFLAGTAFALLWQVAKIAEHGRFYIYEPNPFILSGEITLLALVGGSGLTVSIWAFVQLKQLRKVEK